MIRIRKTAASVRTRWKGEFLWLHAVRVHRSREACYSSARQHRHKSSTSEQRTNRNRTFRAVCLLASSIPQTVSLVTIGSKIAVDSDLLFAGCVFVFRVNLFCCMLCTASSESSEWNNRIINCLGMGWNNQITRHPRDHSYIDGCLCSTNYCAYKRACCDCDNNSSNWRNSRN